MKALLHSFLPFQPRSCRSYRRATALAVLAAADGVGDVDVVVVLLVVLVVTAEKEAFAIAAMLFCLGSTTTEVEAKGLSHPFFYTCTLQSSNDYYYCRSLKKLGTCSLEEPHFIIYKLA